MTDIQAALAGPLEIEGELVSEFLLIASTIGSDDNPGSYRVVMGPDDMPIHSRLGLLALLNEMTDSAFNTALGGGDD